MTGFLLVLVWLGACRDEYWPDLGSKYENLLVVEGMISNNEEPCTVKLTFSTSVDDPREVPAPGFEVILWDNEGNNELLNETAPGIYTSSPEGIKGIPGRYYKITLKSPAGKMYESSSDRLMEPAGIDTVYALLEYREQDVYPYDLPGYQFYIDTDPAADDSAYFVWQLTRTYKYTADFPIFFYYDGILHEVLNPDTLRICWRTDPVYLIFTANLKGLSEPVVKGYPLHFVGFDNTEFSERYSLKVKQLTVSKEVGEFWQALDEINTSSGGMYTHLPYQVRGNVYNIDDEEEPVLGYFMVAGVSEKRLFYDPPRPPAQLYYTKCELHDIDYLEYGWMFIINDPKDWPRLVTVDNNGGRAVPNPFCIDCRLSGGTTVKPEFWID